MIPVGFRTLTGFRTADENSAPLLAAVTAFDRMTAGGGASRGIVGRRAEERPLEGSRSSWRLSSRDSSVPQPSLVCSGILLQDSASSRLNVCMCSRLQRPRRVGLSRSLTTRHPNGACSVSSSYRESSVMFVGSLQRISLSEASSHSHG